ncbi:2-oxoglutarate (2OG) and Fe(II)-dependent oxygenase superfamily protein [Striga asiatica]|uniref:2-oxoglutarate (2OG) and Fe(II)-dependent oxygenase superfamily protein n=1 Tax=Striga asiatica TaxID=4170 RepID=A0A5A7RCS8_STRAF|nr:2-oxoglutarate (2OG) and Fe(II)-dependent oxygenase superfamily protein [Striga asiatica]
MAASWMRFFLILLIILTVGMMIGVLLQLAFIRRLEDSYGAKSSLSRAQSLNADVSYWGDKEAAALRLGYVKPEVISWSPRIIVFHNFLSPEECDYLRAIAKPRLQGMKSKVRTSSGMFLTVEERKYPMIETIEKRISVYSQVPVENGERIQKHRYEKGELYRPHHDYFSDTFNLKHGGQRVATMLMYLSDNVEGGETYFPQAGTGECSCGGEKVPGLCVKPVKGDAVLFWSMGLDGKSDPNSLHGGCAVLSGEKWSATKWMRQSITS